MCRPCGARDSYPPCPEALPQADVSRPVGAGELAGRGKLAGMGSLRRGGACGEGELAGRGSLRGGGRLGGRLMSGGEAEAGGLDPEEGAAVQLGVGEGGCDAPNRWGVLGHPRGVGVEGDNPRCGGAFADEGRFAVSSGRRFGELFQLEQGKIHGLLLGGLGVPQGQH